MENQKNMPWVSYFYGIKSKNPVNITLESFINSIRDGQWKVQTDNYRLMKEKGHEKEATRVKATMPAITVACTCKGGHQEKNIEELTGLIPIDLDHTGERTEEIFRKVCLLSYVAAAFISISNEGIKVIVRAEVDRKENYAYFFQQAARLIEKETGITPDPSGKNLNRLCFGSYHKEAYYNPEAIPMKMHEATQHITKEAEIKPEEPTTDEEEIIFCNAMRELNKKQLYTKGNRNNYIYSLLCKLRRRKMGEAEAERLCLRHFELDEEELSTIVKSAYKQGIREMKQEEKERRTQDAEGNRKEAIWLIEDFITARNELRFNVVTNQTEIRCKRDGKEFEPMTDYEENSILRELLQNGHKITPSLLHNMLNSDLAERHDPFADYFDHLPEWDGKTDYIGRLAAMVITTQAEHWEVCFRKWLVAMVAGWLHPEVVNHTVLVLIGKQGIYKTTWSLKLMPPELKRYRYSGVVDTHTKDGKFTMAQCGLINFEEIENLDRKELNRFKALITQSVINERDFYGRNKEYMIRRASIIASGNNKDILTDMTGNRRWLCFEVLDIATPEKANMMYEGVYAQAKALLDSGFRYWFDKKEMKALNKQNKAFILRSVEEEQLAVWFRKPEEGEAYLLMTATQIMGKMIQWVHTPMSVSRVGRALKAAEYERQDLRANVKVYKVVEIEYTDVKKQGKVE